jgi:hypothetical protein
MFKRILAALLVFAVAGTAAAGPIPGLKAASTGYVSSYTGTGVGFNLSAGERVLMMGGASSVVGFCGLASYLNPGYILLTAFSTQIAQFTAPYSDLYVYVCVKSSGISDDLVLIVMSSQLLEAATKATEVYEKLNGAPPAATPELSAEERAALETDLLGAIERLFP